MIVMSVCVFVQKSNKKVAVHKSGCNIDFTVVAVSPEINK